MRRFSEVELIKYVQLASEGRTRIASIGDIIKYLKKELVIQSEVKTSMGLKLVGSLSGKPFKIYCSDDYKVCSPLFRTVTTKTLSDAVVIVLLNLTDYFV